MCALALTMKDQEVIILMNDLAPDYDMFRMKEKPRKIRARLSRRGCLWGGLGAPRLTRLINVRRFAFVPSFFLSAKSSGDTPPTSSLKLFGVIFRNLRHFIYRCSNTFVQAHADDAIPKEHRRRELHSVRRHPFS